MFCGAGCNFVHQSCVVVNRISGTRPVLFFGLLFPTPRDWLQCRQIDRVFSSSSRPPFECGMMWSVSGLLGWRECSQLSHTPHSGHVVTPFAWSCWRRWAVILSHLLVPVRDVAIDVTSVYG